MGIGSLLARGVSIFRVLAIAPSVAWRAGSRGGIGGRDAGGPQRGDGDGGSVAPAGPPAIWTAPPAVFFPDLERWALWRRRRDADGGGASDGGKAVAVRFCLPPEACWHALMGARVGLGA